MNRIRQSSCSRPCQLASGVESRLIDGDVEEAAIKEEVARDEGRSACHEPEGRSVRVDDSCSASTKSSTRCRMPTLVTLVNAAKPDIVVESIHVNKKDVGWQDRHDT